MSSEPDIVISMLGAKESMNQANFTPDGFVQSYNEFVKDMTNLSSKPQMMFISPIYTASGIIAA